MTTTEAHPDPVTGGGMLNRRTVIRGGAAAVAAGVLSQARAAGATPATLPVSEQRWIDVTTVVLPSGQPWPANSATTDVGPWIRQAILNANHQDPPNEAKWWLDGGGVVYIPPGQHLVASPILLRPGVRLCGDGYATRLIAGGGSGAAAFSMIQIPHWATQTEVSDLRLITGGVGAPVGVFGIKCYTDPNPPFPTPYDAAAWWTHGEHPHIVKHVWIEQNTGTGVFIDAGIRGVLIDDVHVAAAASTTSPWVSGFRLAGQDHVVSGCTASGVTANSGSTSDSGFVVLAPGCRLDGCLATGHRGEGFLLQAERTSCSTSTAIANTPNGHGFRITASRVTVTGAVAVDNDTGLSIAAGSHDIAIGAINASHNGTGLNIANDGSVTRLFLAGIVTANTVNWATPPTPSMTEFVATP